jgi:hypothetical protein
MGAQTNSHSGYVAQILPNVADRIVWTSAFLETSDAAAFALVTDAVPVPKNVVKCGKHKLRHFLVIRS